MAAGREGGGGQHAEIKKTYVLVGYDLAVVALGQVQALVPHVAVDLAPLDLLDGPHLPSLLVDRREDFPVRALPHPLPVYKVESVRCEVELKFLRGGGPGPISGSPLSA